MALKPRPDNKTTEELLKDIHNDNVVIKTKPNSTDDIISFLRFYNLEDGRFRIKDKMLYKLYKFYHDTPRTSESFYRKINNYLHKYQIRKENYYKINQKTANLSEKTLEILKPKREKTLLNGFKLNFDNFIKKFNLKAGTSDSFIWISIDMLYDLYDEWTYNLYKKQSMDRHAFISFCKLYFPKYKISSHITWFQMSETITDTLTEERISRFKARKLNPDEKKPKNSGKVPRSKSIVKSKN